MYGSLTDECTADRTQVPALYVTFACRDIAHVQKGTLYVRVEGMQYVYHVRGHIPDYRPPSGHELVDDHLGLAATRALRRANSPRSRNYIQSNIQATIRGGSRRQLQ